MSLRIILVYVLLMAVAFSCVIYLIINDVRPRYLEAVEESVVDTSELLAALLSQQLEDGVPPVATLEETMTALGQRKFSARIYNIIKRKVDLHIYITDRNGRLLYDSTGRNQPGEDFLQWNDILRTLRGEYGARSTRIHSEDPSSLVLYVAAPIIRDGQLYGVVSVGKPTNSTSFLIAIAQKRFMFSLILVGATAIVLAVGLSFWITRPVRRLTEYARSIRRGERVKIPALGKSEIGVLGSALEEMEAKLEGKNYIEDYVRALTHEMKSPLTGIKGSAEILREHLPNGAGVKFLDNIDFEAERMSSLVGRMLQLSRLENVRTINKSRFGAKIFFQSIAGSFQTQLEARALKLELNVPDALMLEGDELLLRQAVGNLIANAIDFSTRGGVISLNAIAGQEEINIIIRDHGTGIPDFAKDKAFDKFFSLNRPDSGKKSSGLGLPFVREVVALHGGEIRLANATPGLEARIVLPV